MKPIDKFLKLKIPIFKSTKTLLIKKYNYVFMLGQS